VLPGFAGACFALLYLVSSNGHYKDITDELAWSAAVVTFS
jgi:hypothetical protein